MVLYVREKTDQYHDAEVAEVIAVSIGEPVPPGYPRFCDTYATKPAGNGVLSTPCYRSWAT